MTMIKWSCINARKTKFSSNETSLLVRIFDNPDIIKKVLSKEVISNVITVSRVLRVIKVNKVLLVLLGCSVISVGCY